MCVVGVWVFVHLLLLAAALRSRGSLPVCCAVFGLLLIVLIFKPATSDSPIYLEYFSTLDPSIFHGSVELLFERVTAGLSHVFMGSSLFVHWAWMSILLSALAASVRLISAQSLVRTVPLLMAGLFFLLASQNAIRQGVSLAFLFLALCLVVTGRSYLWALAAGVISSLLHDSMILFLLLSVIFILTESHVVARRVPLPDGWLVCVVGALSGLALYVYVALYGGVYGDTEVDWGVYRSSSMTKFVAILFLFVLTSYLMRGRERSAGEEFIASFRKYLLCVLFPLAFSGEIFPRVAMFYLLVESMLMVILLLATARPGRLAGGAIALAYGVAPNALNMLSVHPQPWLELLGDAVT